jgi:AcrR family transcriptional regulator
MSPAVNPGRRYDATRRREQARHTRASVLEAARELFLDRGYAGTTVPEVARRAGVSVETVYKAVGAKPALLKAVVDVAIVGDDEPVALMDREFVRRNMAEPDPRVKLTSYGDHLVGLVPRANPLQLVVRDAAGGDAGAAAVWEQMQSERLTGMTAFAAHLAAGGHLRAGVSADEARDVLWTYTSLELWDLLVNRRGWDTARYGRWIADALVAALL